jgi:hypothetical protein
MQMQDHEQADAREGGEQPTVAPEPKAGAGVRVLQHYLKQGGPDASVVAGVMADFPHDQDTMFRLLHRIVGNAFVQEVSAVMAKQAAPAAEPEAVPAPAAEAPVEETAATASAKPSIEEASAPTSPAAEAATEAAPAAEIVDVGEVAHRKEKPDYKKQAWASQREFLELDSEQQRGRQWVTRFSMQVGGGSTGGFVDIDEFGPKVDVVGTMGHAFEVLRNHVKHVKTDPFTVAKGLHKRGDDP